MRQDSIVPSEAARVVRSKRRLWRRSRGTKAGAGLPCLPISSPEQPPVTGGYWRRRKMRALALLAGLALLVASPPTIQTASAQTVPQFQVDPFWPKPLPNNWLFGQIGGVAVDEQDHVWVLQRPRSLTEDEKGASAKPPRNACCVPAPSVMEFDSDGNLLRHWGGPGMPGVEWVGREHGIVVDHKGFVWLSG